MTSSSDPSFVRVLTVMPDYGNAPFLWFIASPDRGGIGRNFCDGTCWDESLPLSEALWRRFGCAIEEETERSYSACTAPTGRRNDGGASDTSL